jgi:hypothetical protein
MQKTANKYRLILVLMFVAIAILITLGTNHGSNASGEVIQPPDIQLMSVDMNTIMCTSVYSSGNSTVFVNAHFGHLARTSHSPKAHTLTYPVQQGTTMVCPTYYAPTKAHIKREELITVTLNEDAAYTQFAVSPLPARPA